MLKLPLALLLVVVVLCITKIILRAMALKKESSPASPEETRLMQDMEGTLKHLEQRVQTLETLLEDRRRWERMEGSQTDGTLR